MTRSSDEALDEAQLALGTKCERLLSSKAWHKAHTETQKGLLLRLQMLKAAGLPAMRLVSNSKLKALGRIPRSHEGHQVDAIEAVTKCGAQIGLNMPLAILLLCAAAHSNPPTTTCPFCSPLIKPSLLAARSQLLAPLEAAQLVRDAAEGRAVERPGAAAGDGRGPHVWRPRRRGALEGARADRVRRVVQAQGE